MVARRRLHSCDEEEKMSQFGERDSITGECDETLHTVLIARVLVTDRVGCLPEADSNDCQC